MSTGKVVIGGSTGFMGSFLVPRMRAAGREVVTVSRSGADIRWGDQAAIDRAVDGASLVIGLAGKSVNSGTRRRTVRRSSARDSTPRRH